MAQTSLVDTYLLYEFLRRLALPFKYWKAYKTGVIDEEGNILVPEKYRTPEQRDSFLLFDVVVRNMKRLIGVVPGGKTAVASVAAAYLLLKEQKGETIHGPVDLAVSMVVLMENPELLIENEVTNTVGGGAVAGVDMSHRPPRDQWQKRKGVRDDLLRRIKTRQVGSSKAAFFEGTQPLSFRTFATLQRDVLNSSCERGPLTEEAFERWNHSFKEMKTLIADEPDLVSEAVMRTSFLHDEALDTSKFRRLMMEIDFGTGDSVAGKGYWAAKAVGAYKHWKNSKEEAKKRREEERKRREEAIKANPNLKIRNIGNKTLPKTPPEHFHPPKRVRQMSGKPVPPPLPKGSPTGPRQPVHTGKETTGQRVNLPGFQAVGKGPQTRRRRVSARKDSAGSIITHGMTPDARRKAMLRHYARSVARAQTPEEKARAQRHYDRVKGKRFKNRFQPPKPNVPKPPPLPHQTAKPVAKPGSGGGFVARQRSVGQIMKQGQENREKAVREKEHAQFKDFAASVHDQAASAYNYARNMMHRDFRKGKVPGKVYYTPHDDVAYKAADKIRDYTSDPEKRQKMNQFAKAAVKHKVKQYASKKSKAVADRLRNLGRRRKVATA